MYIEIKNLSTKDKKELAKALKISLTKLYTIIKENGYMYELLNFGLLKKFEIENNIESTNKDIKFLNIEKKVDKLTDILIEKGIIE